MNPHNIEMEDNPSAFFNMVLGVSNTRNLKSQDHHDEERGLNRVLCHSCGIESNANGAKFHRQWLEEDVWKWVAKGVDNIGAIG